MNIIAHALYDVSYIEILLNSWKAGGYIMGRPRDNGEITAKILLKVNELISQFPE